MIPRDHKNTGRKYPGFFPGKPRLPGSLIRLFSRHERCTPPPRRAPRGGFDDRTPATNPVISPPCPGGALRRGALIICGFPCAGMNDTQIISGSGDWNCSSRNSSKNSSKNSSGNIHPGPGPSASSPSSNGEPWCRWRGITRAGTPGPHPVAGVSLTGPGAPSSRLHRCGSSWSGVR